MGFKMNGKLVITKATEHTIDNHAMFWHGFSTKINELIIIEVRATGNEYLVEVINSNSQHNGYSCLINPPKELIDNVNLLNGSLYDCGDEEDDDFRSRSITQTFRGLELNLLGLYRSLTNAERIFRHFRFFDTVQTIEYTQIETTPPPQPRAIKV